MCVCYNEYVLGCCVCVCMCMCVLFTPNVYFTGKNLCIKKKREKKRYNTVRETILFDAHG